MADKEEPKPIDIASFKVPLARIALSIFLLIGMINYFFDLITGVFHLSKGISFIFLLANGLLIIFYIIELRFELKKASYSKAIYFRIAALITELVLILRNVFSITMLLLVDIKSPESWVFILQDFFLLVLLIILIRQNFLRTRMLFH